MCIANISMHENTYMMLSKTYYAQAYAGMIGLGLDQCPI